MCEHCFDFEFTFSWKLIHKGSYLWIDFIQISGKLCIYGSYNHCSTWFSPTVALNSLGIDFAVICMALLHTIFMILCSLLVFKTCFNYIIGIVRSIDRYCWSIRLWKVVAYRCHARRNDETGRKRYVETVSWTFRFIAFSKIWRFWKVWNTVFLHLNPNDARQKQNAFCSVNK